MIRNCINDSKRRHVGSSLACWYGYVDSGAEDSIEDILSIGAKLGMNEGSEDGF